MPTCHNCGCNFPGILDLQRHFKIIHDYDRHSSIYKCGEALCFKTYPNWSKFRTHLKSHHGFSKTDSHDIPAKIPCLSISVDSSNGNQESCNFENADGDSDRMEDPEPPVQMQDQEISGSTKNL